MNQKKLRKRSLSWLLVLSMVLSLFGGSFTIPQKAKAAEGDATITFGESKINASGYYTYPDVKVTIPDSTKRIHNLTVTVNSGYIKVTSTRIEDLKGNYTTGKGILTTESIQEKNEKETGESAGLNAGSSTEDLSTDSTSRYESISFDFDASYKAGEISPGATVDSIQSFLRTLRFTTSETEGQQVTISATTLGDTDLKTTIDGQEITLHYFNGHFYGYVSKWCTWRQAYDATQTAKFKGVQGYLATLTTRAEDRFLLSTFPLNDNATTNKAKEGWIGCTRATLDSVLNGTEAKDLPKMTSAKDPNFRWRWVTGPEKGEEFGYQTNAYGQSGTWGNSYLDGGFEADKGKFSNWGNRDNGEWNIEPNGGGQSDEAFGYYGRYLYGRWNDYSADAGVTGYYIEFGGMPGDDETFKDNLTDQIIITSSETEPEIVNPNVDPVKTSAAPKRKLTGTPVVENRNEDKENKVGVRLYANTDDVGPDDATYNYKWYVKNPDTDVWEELPSTNDYITLTEDLLDHQIKVELIGTNDFEDSVLSSNPYDAAITKDAITGEPVVEPKDKDDPLEAGSVLVANVDDIGPEVDTKDNLHYQWYVVEEDGTKKEVGKDEPTYVLKEEDLGKDVVVKVTADPDSIYTGSAESEPLPIPAPVVTAAPSADPSASPAVELQMITGRPIIVNENTDEHGAPINKAGTVLKATIDEIKPDGAKESLLYQWYIREPNGMLTPIEGATEPTYTLTEDDLDKNLVVSVTGNEEEGYYGTRNSLPYSAIREKTPISGKPVIVNKTKNDEGKDVKREGTILTANIEGIDPNDSHNTLTYQWYVKDGDDLVPIKGATEQSYILTTDEVDKELVVKATGNDKYKGTVSSDPYDTTRTDSGVSIGEPDEKGLREIVVSPTMEDTIYAIVDASGDGTPLIDIPTKDENGFDLSPNVFTEEYPGYYRPAIAGGKLIFTVEADKEYIIYAVRDKAKDVIIVGPDIDDVELKDYDDKGTPEDNEDDTVSVEVNPADVNYKYAILKKEDGEYIDLTITYDPETKEYVYDPNSETKFTPGGDGKVVFSELPAEGTYKVVAIPIDSDVPDFDKIKPNQIEGGSVDIESHAKANVPKPSTTPEGSNPPSSEEPSAAPSSSAAPTGDVSAAPTGSGAPTTSGAPAASGTPAASGAPATSASPSPAGSNLTPEEEDAVTKFINNYVTDPNGSLITSITDLTKDIILSGETEWNKLTATEQNAVNERIKAAGSPYTYEELLAMANAYKIPGFKLHKVMKKKSKAKLKLMKCNGATVVVTSTNKKVATINKKGVIKAKKVGKATLTITAVKGNYSNRLVVNLEVRKKFKNATELKKFKSKVIKTPTILIAKKRKLKKSTKIKIYGLEKNAKVKYKSYNKKALPINKKGKYTAKKKGKSLMRVTVQQNDKVYYLYLYVTAFKKGGKKK